MISHDHTLELCNVYHTGQVEPGTWLQRATGRVKTGVLLKDVSLAAGAGEVLAVLGSKGSGKRALLDVVARRVRGPTRGQLLLHGAPLTLAAFRARGAYVTHACDIPPALTVHQALLYTPTRLSGHLKASRVKQVMADLALSQVANRCVRELSHSEYRRLSIGVQLVRDPVLLLLDEPTWDLDPLNTYLVVSILSNVAKKYGTTVVLSMEKPRSDVFPFLDQVLYLCLGDVVYTGGTRQMLEYFNAIGFPCPQLENPLMYYLCLSTVDRRSRERFVESNHQIAALVDKFKLEGGAFRKGSSVMGPQMDQMLGHAKMPMSYGKPSGLQVTWTLYMRLLAATFSFTRTGLQHLFLRLLVLPLYFLLMWVFYRDMEDYQHTYVSRSGLIFNSLAGVYFLAIINTVIMFPMFRTRYYQEAQEGLYSGPLFLLTYNLVSLPFSFISVLGSNAIVYSLTGDSADIQNFLYSSLVLWGCYVFSEQQTMAILMTVKDSVRAAVASIYITCICLIIGSGILRSMKGLQEWLFYISYATQVRYAAAFLNRQVFLGIPEALPYDAVTNCTQTIDLRCKYANGQGFLTERYSRESTDVIFSGILDHDLNLGVTFAFATGFVIFNMFLYLIPLPAYVKAKFRE